MPPFYGKFDGDKAVKGLKNTSAPEDFANAGNPLAKDDPDPGGDPQEKSFLTEEEESQVIDFLKSLGKTDDEIDKILHIPAHARPSQNPGGRNETRKIIEDE